MSENIHNLIIESRNKAVVSGVTDIGEFDDKNICMYTCDGRLIVKGTEFHMVKMSLETGDVIFEGHINSVEYSNKHLSRNENVIKKIFR